MVLGTEDYIIFWASVRGTQYAKKFSLALAQQHDAPPSNLLLARRWGWGRVGVTPVFFLFFARSTRSMCYALLRENFSCICHTNRMPRRQVFFWLGWRCGWFGVVELCGCDNVLPFVGARICMKSFPALAHRHGATRSIFKKILENKMCATVSTAAAIPRL